MAVTGECAMMPSPFEKLTNRPMPDLEQALSFEFFYQARPQPLHTRLAIQLKKGLKLRPARFEWKGFKRATEARKPRSQTPHHHV
jgi:hypothetical protein